MIHKNKQTRTHSHKIKLLEIMLDRETEIHVKPLIVGLHKIIMNSYE